MSRRTLIQLGVVMITIAAAAPLFAIPASPALAWLEQPDGTRFQARQWGDEWLSGWETAEGYTIVRDDATGWWYFAVRSPEGALVAGAKAVGVEGPLQEVQRHLRPAFQELEPALQLRAQGIEKLRARAQAVTGTRNVPIFLVTFSDRSPTYSTSQFNQMLFATGANSLRDYYREVSYNQLAVAGTVNGWYTAPQDHDYYGWDAGSEFEQKDWRVGDLVRAVAESADASGFDFSPYDTDGDCKVDIFAVVHQGTDQADSNGSPTDIWSHRSSLTYQNQHKGASRGAYVTNDACRAGGAVTVDDYMIQPENAADGGMVTVGVFAHEYAHALGLPDLYDYKTDSTDSWGVGIWSLMSAGNFLGTSREGDRPGHLDPWSKIALGWVTPQLVTGTRTNEAISPATTAADVYQLLSGNVDAGGEYFLVENRQKSGFDTGLPAGGVLVWHIDDSWWPSNYRINDNECYPGGPSCASQHYHVAVVQADGLWELEKYIHPGNAGDLFPGSTNNTSFTATSTPSSALYSGAASNVSITSIASGGSGGTMTATLSVTGGGGSGGQTVTIYSDGFEGAFPGSFGLFPSSATTTWGKSTYRKVTGNYSLWCAGGGSNAQPAGGQYVPNMETWFYYGPFSLADAASATAEFDVWYQTESNYDLVKLMLSVNGQNFYGYQWSGSSGGWQHVTVNFADVTQIQTIGAPQVWIAGIFTSDGSTQYEGAYVDNLVIKKTTAGQSCTYSISPTSQSFSSAAGTGSVSVTASGTSCSWTASSGVSWVTITSGSSGTGNGTVNYSVAANTGNSSRTGTLTVAGQTFTVTQSGAASCSYSISPTSRLHTAVAETGTVSVTASSGQCTWTALSNVSWVTITGGSSGTGNGTVSYSVAANSSTSTRSGTLAIANQIFTVNQSGASGGNYRYLIPAIAHSPGANNTAWRSDISIVNRSGSSASVTVGYTSNTDSMTGSYSATMPNGSALSWQDVLSSLFGLAQAGVNQGTVQITSTAPLSAVGRTYNQTATATFGQAYPAVAVGEAISAGRTAILPHLANNPSNGGYRTNIGIVNLGAGACSVAVRLYDGNGNQVGTTQTISADPGKFAQNNGTFNNAGAGYHSTAYAVVSTDSASCSFWGFATVVDNVSGDPTTIEMFPQ